ncbi:MAG: alpha/beta hydrolase family protein [Synechococcus sp.]
MPPASPQSRPLPADVALGRTPVLRDPQPLGHWVLWLEQRPQERGRTTALIRPWQATDRQPQELTPAPCNLRSRVHDYGGGVLACHADGDQLLLVWIDDGDGCLWSQRWQGLDQSSDNAAALDAMAPPRRLTTPGAVLADGLIDPQRQRWLGVMEDKGRDWLVSVSLQHENQIPEVLHAPRDFAGYMALSSDGQQLAWVEWEQPWMPWDASSLWVAALNDAGMPQSPSLVAGSDPSRPERLSVFQPQWLPDGRLLVAEDRSGWWNLMVSHAPPSDTTPLAWHRPWPMAAEAAMPQWIYGMSTTAWDGDYGVAAVCDQGVWQLKRLSDDGAIDAVDQPFSDLAGLRASDGRVVAIASNASTGMGLLELDLVRGHWTHSVASDAGLDPEQISIAEALWFEGSGGQRTHAWYYPPLGERTQPAPLLVKGHSGPTAMARTGLNLGIQFWTSRGWGVVDVNYGGSTGFGRAYRDRLQTGWGVVDVEDCAAAARALIASGHAHPDQIAMEGGSAGGFTTLACLCFTDVFKAGACRYAVSDLTAMATDTHRFEARYLDGLVGPWPQAQALYDQRSPLLHADQIRCPVIFFQGLKDQVVPPEQTERMAAALRGNGIAVEVLTFPEEGHGFRDSAVQSAVLEATEAFFRHHLKIGT